MGNVTHFVLMLLAFMGLCVWLVLEKRLNRRARAGFLAVIHVNGIRGKTSTCRMLDAVLREKFRVFTKTTGSDPRVLHVDGRDLPLRRLGPPNIGEQIRMLRMARREGAEIVILECMAVRPDLQCICEEQILRSDISIITNVRYDHVLEMGSTLDEIAAALSGTIPSNGTLYTGDAAYYPYFAEKCEAKGSTCVLCPQDKPGEENHSIVQAVSASLGLEDTQIGAGLQAVRPDAGMRSLFSLQNKQGRPVDFLNLFAANDPQSAWQRAAAYMDEYPSVFFAYNSRSDRPDRTLLFAEHFFPQIPNAKVFLLGNGTPLARRLLGKAVPTLTLQNVKDFDSCLDIPTGSLLIGLGNIKGEPFRFLNALGQEAEKI